jgi:RNA polymerase sigma-70 factor (ECF subfamily)
MNCAPLPTLGSVKTERRPPLRGRPFSVCWLVVEPANNLASGVRSPEELIERVATARDREAFSALFRLFAPGLRSFALRRGVSGANAEELVQEVMLQIWRRAETYRPEKAGAATWIFAIARNRLLDEARRPALAVAPAEEADKVPAEAVDDDFRIDTVRHAERLRQALVALPPEQSEIIRIAYYEGVSQRDLAARLGLPLGTVKSRTRLALERLREALKRND